MSSPITKAYIINEGKTYEEVPKILKKSKEVIRYKLDCIQEGDTVNRNQRDYPYELLVEACKHPYVQERINTRSFYCEVGHPVEQTIKRQMRIDRLNCASMIVELLYNKPRIGGIYETLATNLGRDLMGLIEHNETKIAYSMRGLGKTVQDGNKLKVVRPFRIICWDDVVHPSVPNAYLSNVLSESSDLVNNRILNDNPTKLLVEDEEFAKYILECSPDAKNVLNHLEIDPNEKNNKLFINERGNLVLNDERGKVIVLTESYIKNEIQSYLASNF